MSVVEMDVSPEGEMIDALSDDQIATELADLLDFSAADEAGVEPEFTGDEMIPERTSDRIKNSRDLLATYNKQINKEPLLTAEEEVELAKKIEAGLYARYLLDGGSRPEQEALQDITREELETLAREGEEAKLKFIHSNLKLARTMARRYYRGPMELLDRVQASNIWLMYAVERFDFTRGTKFSTHATWWLWQGINRAKADNGLTIRIPKNLYTQVEKFNADRNELYAKFGYRLSDEELADELKIPLEQIRTFKNLSNTVDSLDKITRDEDGTDNELVDTLADNKLPPPDRVAIDSYLRARLQEALGKFGEDEQKIIIMRYGLDGNDPRVLDEIAAQFGTNREKIKRMLSIIHSKMRHPGYPVDLQGMLPGSQLQEWRSQAKCKNEGDFMYPDSKAAHKVKASVCMGCTVMKECFEVTIVEEVAAGEAHGVRAGLTANERRPYITALYKKRRARKKAAKNAE
jgi:RNA polymerase nonessential primary-like sigma factor